MKNLLILKSEKEQSSKCKNIDFIVINDRKSYLISSNNVLLHIITADNLTYMERLYYFLADLYSSLNESLNGVRETEKSGLEWAKLLDCSEEWVFKMQKSLENKGYFSIIREKDEDNQNEKNIIIPTLPDNVFDELAKTPNRFGKEYLVFVANNHAGCKRSYLDSSKLFITFNLPMLKLLLIDSSLSALQKLIWLHCYCRSHIAYTDSNGEGTRKFITTYQEVATFFSCKENTISIATNKLAEHGYIGKKQFRTKVKDKASRRKKKSCWEIEALFPQNLMELVLQQPDRQNLPPLTADDLRLYGVPSNSNPQQDNLGKSYYYHDRSGDPHQTSQYYNKYNISNINKNTDQSFLDLNSKEEKVTPDPPIELIALPEEIAQGLNIAEKFNAKTLELANTMPYQEALRMADLEITAQEHWLVTKTAYTLQQKLQTPMQATNIVNTAEQVMLNAKKQSQITQTEQLLMEMWTWFADDFDPKNPEFLLRKSWLTPLLSGANFNKNTEQTSMQTTTLQSEPILILTGDKDDKARKFAYAIRSRGLAQGYAAEIPIDDLVQEFIYHAANWVPERLNCTNRDEQIDAALSFAWRAANTGKWRCPYGKLNEQVLQREQDARQWKC